MGSSGESRGKALDWLLLGQRPGGSDRRRPRRQRRGVAVHRAPDAAVVEVWVDANHVHGLGTVHRAGLHLACLEPVRDGLSQEFAQAVPIRHRHGAVLLYEFLQRRSWHRAVALGREGRPDAVAQVRRGAEKPFGVVTLLLRGARPRGLPLALQAAGLRDKLPGQVAQTLRHGRVVHGHVLRHVLPGGHRRGGGGGVWQRYVAQLAAGGPRREGHGANLRDPFEAKAGVPAGDDGSTALGPGVGDAVEVLSGVGSVLAASLEVHAVEHVRDAEQALEEGAVAALQVRAIRAGRRGKARVHDEHKVVILPTAHLIPLTGGSLSVPFHPEHLVSGGRHAQDLGQPFQSELHPGSASDPARHPRERANHSSRFEEQARVVDGLEDGEEILKGGWQLQPYTH
mmetsp:Transcript_3554/g.9670  ORF Transcript_3554/g.9670 Transcript_3554/m.9670 type:complete len:398 (+) Transcript_3554:3688-4881(+)